MCDGEWPVAFQISAGSCWLTVLIALSPVKSPQARTDSVLQKNLTPSSKKYIFKQGFGYSKFSTAQKLKKHFKNCVVTVQTLYAECNLYINPKQIEKKKNKEKKRQNFGAFLTIFSLFLLFPSPFCFYFMCLVVAIPYVLLLIPPLPIHIHHFISPVHPQHGKALT